MIELIKVDLLMKSSHAHESVENRMNQLDIVRKTCTSLMEMAIRAFIASKESYLELSASFFTFLYLNVTDLRDMNYFGNTEKST